MSNSGWLGHAKSAFGLQDVEWPEEQLERCKQEYITEAKKASTTEGYWNDVTTFFVIAHKASEAVA